MIVKNNFYGGNKMTAIPKQTAPKEPERNVNQKKSDGKEIITIEDLKKFIKVDQDSFRKVLNKEATKLPDHSIFKKILQEVSETVNKAVTINDYKKAADAIMEALSRKDDKAVIYSLKQEIKEIIKRKMNRPRLEPKSLDPKSLEPEVKEFKEEFRSIKKIPTPKQKPSTSNGGPKKSSETRDGRPNSPFFPRRNDGSKPW
jgi:hypothetical protein